MDAHDRDELVGIMQRLARAECGSGDDTRDEAALVELFVRFGDRVAGTMRRLLVQRSADDVRRDELMALAWDGCEAIAEVARSWSPDGGALPWTWARRRLGNIVDRHIGQRCEPLGTDLLERLEATGPGSADGSSRVPGGDRAPAGGDDASSVWARLVPTDARALGFDAVLRRVVPDESDRALYLEYQFQKHDGDPSPSATIGTLFNLQPDAVRQRIRRTKQRVRGLAATDPELTWLAELPVLA